MAIGVKPCIPLKPITTPQLEDTLYKNDIGLGHNVAIGYQSGIGMEAVQTTTPVLKNQHI